MLLMFFLAEYLHLLSRVYEKLGNYNESYKLALDRNKTILNSQTTFSRILVKHSFRNQGLGREIIKKALCFVNNEPVVMSAQLYLKKFYEEFGFQTIGSTFLEDNIPHIKMIKY